MLSLITPPDVVSNPQDLCSSLEHKLRYFIILIKIKIRVRKLSDLIKHILICVLKMHEGLMGLERHEGE